MTKCDKEQLDANNKRSLLAILEDLVALELKKFQWYLNQDVLKGFPPIPKSQLENITREDMVDKMVQTYSLDGAKKVSLTILTLMNRNDLTQRLQAEYETDVTGSWGAGEIRSTSCFPVESLSHHSSSSIGTVVASVGEFTEYDQWAEYKRKHQLSLKSKYQKVLDGMTQNDKKTLLNSIYTEVYITEAGGGEVNREHEVRQIESAYRIRRRPEMPIKCSDIFKPSAGQDALIQTVLTKGIAGIGKTISVQKFVLDWAEGKDNKDIDFVFPLPFRQLNLLKHEKYSVIDVIHKCFTKMDRECLDAIFTNGLKTKSKFKVLFILDGLDEFYMTLNCKKLRKSCYNVTEPNSVDVLLTNLIVRNLLPSALLWITTRPAAANQIPSDYLDLVTEVRGFNDQQKEEFLRKRFHDDEQLASQIISHIRTSRSLYIMCHIPVISSIVATVFENVGRRREMPKTLTQIYTHFLVVQLKKMNVKYHEKGETDSPWTEENIKMIQSLAKLAFRQLEKGKLVFYEEDLRKSGIDFRGSVDHSGVCTEIFSEDDGVSEDKVYCFVHLTIQELFAALHVFLSFHNSNVNLMTKQQSWKRKAAILMKYKPSVTFYKCAVFKALKSENGHCDLFLRFLLGLSLESNQTRLRGVLTQTRSSSQSYEETVKYIKKKIRENPSPERCMNLFHCLNELNDHSLEEEIQHYLISGSLSGEDLSPAQWSAISFVLLTSEEKLDVFDLQKFSRTEEGLLRLLPVVKASKTALLNHCNLSGQCCETLASALLSSDLIELDLSGNDLGDSGVKLLSAGLGNPHCKLEILRLSHCLVTKQGCASLAAALRSNPYHLKEVDLSCNHPGISGVKLLSARLKDPHCRLEKLNVDHCGEFRIKQGLRRYACELTLDPNTAQRILSLSEENRKVTRTSEEQSHPDHPERFLCLKQVLCREGLSGRCYWEAEWSGSEVSIGVTYKGIGRRGATYDCAIGYNDKSWTLECDDNNYSAFHKNEENDIPVLPSGSYRVGVYLDWPAGTLCFYRVSSDTLTHLHTFHTTFTEPLYPGFWLGFDSSVSLCQVE